MHEQHVEHVIVGAGFSGLCAAIKLQEDGETDFLVVEKGATVGGTWRDNTYPGAACDVPSQLYSFSFAPNPAWSSSFSPQPEIQAYLERVAQRSGTLDRFVFRTALVDAAWDEPTRRWTVRLDGPDGARTLTSSTLVVGAGQLSEPRLPDIEGLDTFAGALFHSARWDHDTDLRGKRVAVIGTGASAIQIVPAVREVAAHLDVYQRTAPWVIPRSDRRYPAPERWALRHLPGLQGLYRTGVYWSREGLVPGLTVDSRLSAPVKRLAQANLRRGVRDPELRRRLTPDFEIGCKRILISNTYYPAIASADVDLVTDPIARITPTGIVTADGTERTVDAIVVATGFHTTDLPIADRIRDDGGRTLADVWAETGMAAYKGTTVPGFPNLFLLVGPNTGQGHTSMVVMIEAQVGYVVDAVRTMRRRGWATVEPRRGDFADWNAALQRRMQRTVWTTGGCHSWYLDEHGNNTTLWPGSTVRFRRELARFDPPAYVCLPPPTQAPTDSTADETSQEEIPA